MKETVHLSCEAIAEAVGYRYQDGGMCAQVRRTVVAAFARDLARAREELGTTAPDISVTDSGDGVDFTVRIACPSHHRLPMESVGRIDAAIVRHYSPPDRPHLQIPLRILLKARRAMGILEGTARRTWLLALYEIENGLLTRAGEGRRFRGEGLKAALRSIPLDDVLWGLLSEEHLDPDLTLPEGRNTAVWADRQADRARIRRRDEYHMGPHAAYAKRRAEEEAEELRREAQLAAYARYRGAADRDGLTLPARTPVRLLGKRDLLWTCSCCGRAEKLDTGLASDLFPNWSISFYKKRTVERHGHACCPTPELYAQALDRDGQPTPLRGLAAEIDEHYADASMAAAAEHVPA